MGWKTAAGSTGRLLQLCFGYFFFYVLTGIVVKVFTGGLGRPAMPEIAYLVNNTLGGTALALPPGHNPCKDSRAGLAGYRTAVTSREIRRSPISEGVRRGPGHRIQPSMGRARAGAG